MWSKGSWLRKAALGIRMQVCRVTACCGIPQCGSNAFCVLSPLFFVFFFSRMSNLPCQTLEQTWQALATAAAYWKCRHVFMKTQANWGKTARSQMTWGKGAGGKGISINVRSLAYQFAGNLKIVDMKRGKYSRMPNWTGWHVRLI